MSTTDHCKHLHPDHNRIRHMEREAIAGHARGESWTDFHKRWRHVLNRIDWTIVQRILHLLMTGDPSGQYPPDADVPKPFTVGATT